MARCGQMRMSAMAIVVTSLITVLFVNAVVSFIIAFFWQAKVIFTVFGVSDWTNAYSPWKALGDQKSPQNTFGRFVAGEIFPELRQKWQRAIGYVAISFVTLFVVAGLLKIIVPEYVL
jgi:hypothetical protein